MFILLWGFLLSFWGFAEEPEKQTPEKQAEILLRQAETWYYLARLTENDLSAHQLSQKAYDDVRRILKDQTSPKAILLREQAEQADRSAPDPLCAKVPHTHTHTEMTPAPGPKCGFS